MTGNGDGNRSFPGGRVRLPKLGDRDAAEPEVTFVGTAFVRNHDDASARGRVASGFAEYYTTESLFEPPDPQNQPDLNDPYYILGVSREASWREIVVAHRNLCKAFHPDRFAGHPPEVIARADENIKRINMAYAELNRRIKADAID